jgi:arylsulfatase A-like enzyme
MPLPTLLVLLAGCGTSPSRPPNILLVTLDTTRADMIGAFGNKDVQTPTLDRLAAGGARFERAYTVTPLTIPAHSSIMTGLWPPRHGVRDNGDFFLSDDAHTLAETLRDGGYRTMASVGAEVTSHHWGFSQGFDAFYDDMGEQDTDGNRWRVERTADKVVADAESWFDQRPADDTRPWFAWVHFFDAHHPYEPPEPYASLFPTRPYLGEISFVDSQLGALLAHLKEKGQLDNTWIVATGDHGEGLGSHGEQMHGVLLYDATTHIPIIIKPPEDRPAKVVSTPVSLVDLMPTILAAAHVPAPTGLDGIDLTPLVLGDGAGDAARTVYAESLYAFHHYGWAQQKALVTNDRKLIDSTTPEVYARGDDDEKHDLAPTDAAGLADLEQKLDTLEKGMGPAAVTAQPAAMSAERTAQLEALGYLTADAGAAADATGLPDPVKHLPSLKRLETARQAMREGRLDDAKTAAQAVIKEEPELTEAKMVLANVLGHQGDPAGAYAIVAEEDAKRPGSQTKMLMGAFLMAQGKLPEAIVDFQAALAVDPYLEGAWTMYLRSILLTGDLERFLPETARALTALPNSASIRGLRGIALAMHGNFAEAEPLLDEGLRSEPGAPMINHAMGITLRALGKPTQAETMLSEEIRLFPPAIASRRALVEMYADQKRYEEQLAQLDAIAAVEPPNPLTLHSIAQAQFNLKRYPDAEKSVRECRELAPEYPGCAMLEANVLKKLGKDAEAQAVYLVALKLAKQAPPEPTAGQAGATSAGAKPAGGTAASPTR